MTNIKLQLLCMQSFVMQIQSHCKSLTFPLNYIYVLHGPAFDSIQNIQDSSISIKKDMVFFFFFFQGSGPRQTSALNTNIPNAIVRWIWSLITPLIVVVQTAAVMFPDACSDLFPGHACSSEACWHEGSRQCERRSLGGEIRCVM